jgi:outer membrane protein
MGQERGAGDRARLTPSLRRSGIPMDQPAIPDMPQVYYAAVQALEYWEASSEHLCLPPSQAVTSADRAAGGKMRARSRVFFFLVAIAALISTVASAQTLQTLTLQQAEQIALQNHPRVQAATALASAAEAERREVRSAYYPTADGDLTGAESVNSNRIGAGGLNSPRIFDKYANGVSVSQLVTDFGHTQQLVKSSSLHARAQEENVVTSRADVLLAVDQAYYGVLRAQALLRVAEQTVSERQVVSNQITEMAANQLKSQLDVTFVDVDLAQSQLVLIQAKNNLQASYARFTTALGFANQQSYNLTEETQTPPPPTDVASLVQQAMMNRPELVGQRFEVNSAQSFATAQRDLWFPVISVVGTAGLIPFHTTAAANGLYDQYAAAGFNVTIPIFNGHLFGALRNEATARAQAQQQNLRDLQDRIVQDVNEAWLDANSGYQRLSVAQQLVNQSTLSLNLAQSRYQLNLSSIVELTQSQLNLTQAQIEQVNATYDYETELAVVNYSIGNLR